jgi:hypothetical protein
MGVASFVTTRFVTGSLLVDTALFLGTAGVVAVASYAANRLAVFR